MLEGLAAVGLIYMTGTVILICVLLCEYIKEKVEIYKWEYKRKHRFDKPPTAKCYCKDCIYYEIKSNGIGVCHSDHIYEYWSIADSCFCWRAEPLKHDPDTEKAVQNER